eukprot:jgi/Mesvir1/15455/Mv11436-RA.1
MSMYIRVKRKRSTYFLHVEPSETILEVKEKIQGLTDKSVDCQRLFLDTTNLDDARSLADLKIENDAVIALTFKENGEWEAIDVEVLENQDEPPENGGFTN